MSGRRDFIELTTSNRQQDSSSDEEGARPAAIAFAIDDKFTPLENAISLTTQLQEKWCPVAKGTTRNHWVEIGCGQFTKSLANRPLVKTSRFVSLHKSLFPWFDILSRYGVGYCLAVPRSAPCKTASLGDDQVPEPQTANRKPKTPKPKPQTPNPKTQNPNPKP
jgi:hypothetical protein